MSLKIATSSRIHVCRPGWEGPLVDELSRVFPGAAHEVRQKGWVSSRFHCTDDLIPCVAFADQCLPDPVPVRAGSIADWAGLVSAFLMERLADHQGPWRLHVFGVEYPGSPVRQRRCDLIQKGVLELLGRKQKRLVRTCVTEHELPFAPYEILVQAGLETPGTGFLSLARPEMIRRLRRCLSRFPGGRVSVPEDPRPPSRAYQKLVEAELRLGFKIRQGETVVDLGASPGGWTFVALDRGAQVTAVDRSPLRSDLMRRQGLCFVKGDGFSHRPQAAVDWLLSDIIAFPERSIDLIDRWVSNRWCRRFIVSVKFKGTDDYLRLETLKRILERSGAEFSLRRLDHGKNEVAAFGDLSG